MSKEHRAGFVAVVGRPNVGKSTLINYYLKQKVAAVSPRPQTTRRTQLGILSLAEAQVVFKDTPGIHEPLHRLGEMMNKTAEETIRNCDVVLWLVSGNEHPTREDKRIAQFLSTTKLKKPVIMGLNKDDLGNIPVERQRAFTELWPIQKAIRISALTGEHCQELLDEIILHLPVSQSLFDEEQITDLYEREITADLIREAALMELRDEIPHGIAVRVDEYKERNAELVHVAATLLVEKESHKCIVIGKQGGMLKKIGSKARQEMESMSGRKIYLEMRVKVQKNWRNDPSILKQLGYGKKEER